MLSLVIAAASFLSVAVLIYKFAYAPYGVLKKMGVKGPAPRPFWGNAKEFVKDPFAMIQKLHDTYGDVSGFYIGAMPVIVIADQELLKLVLVKQFDSFTDRIDILVRGISEKFALPPSLVVSKGEQWKNSRHAISPTFTGAKMKQMVPIVQKCMDKLQMNLGKFSERGETIDIKRHLGFFTMESILAVAFGRQVELHTSDKEEDPLTKAARTIFDVQRPNSGAASNLFTVVALKSQLPFVNRFMPYLTPKALMNSFRYLYETSKALVESRRQEGQSVKHNDFLQLMLDLESENGSNHNTNKPALFTNGDLVANSITFLIAGFETTATCLAYTSYLLAVNPAVQDKLCQELDDYFKAHSISTGIYEATHEIEYLDMVVQESLRIFPPAPLVVGRMSKEDVQVGGLNIQKGSAVLVPVMSIHHDKKIWGDPENFRPERFSAEEKEIRPQLCHMPFGWGPRNCIGMRFALMEIKMTLISVLQKYKFAKALETEVPLQTVATGLTLAPKNAIYLKILPRN